MKKHFALGILIAVFAAAYSPNTAAQVSWSLGGNTGISIYDGAAGFHIGPMSEVIFGRNFAVGSEFNINTQGGTPIEWYAYGKYYFAITGSKLRPFANFGLALYFYTGGPYFGIQGGGGVNIPIANKLYIAPDIQFGPVFGTGGSSYFDPFFGIVQGQSRTVFAVIIRAGIRYEI
jgi:hypothetical protein